jgi:hypothetical protein
MVADLSRPASQGYRSGVRADVGREQQHMAQASRPRLVPRTGALRAQAEIAGSAARRGGGRG